MIDPRTPPLLYNLREYSRLKSRQLAGLPFPSDGLYNGEWMTFGSLLKGATWRKLGIFDRNGLVEDLLKQYSQGGKQKNVLSDNIQLTLLAGAERALFHRMLTPSRALAHASARYSGMGTENTSIFDHIQDKLNNLESV